MTTSANPLLENCCCSPCGDDCCNNKLPVSIESTNPNCLRVDTSECWVVKLEPVCPPEVVAGTPNVDVTYMECDEWEDCSWKYIVSVECDDEKVKACEGDSTPWYLDDKLEAGHWITITSVWCSSGADSSLRIAVDESEFNLDLPHIEVRWKSNLINLVPGWDNWHVLYLSDKEGTTYDNMCCIGFTGDQDFVVEIDNHGNADAPLFMWENWKNWSIYTGNHAMATRQWIKILADWYYRLFWQITVQNNIDDDFYFNLWRWLLRIHWDRAALNDNMYLSTAKHWAYARQMLLEAGSGITITNQWEISASSWDGQDWQWYNWPWMTFNIDTLVDLKKDDVITIWYRPQSNNMSNPDYNVPGHTPIYGTFRFVWQNDSSTEYNALFWWTLLWVYQLAPKRFQEWAGNEVYWTI